MWLSTGSASREESSVAIDGRDIPAVDDEDSPIGEVPLMGSGCGPPVDEGGPVPDDGKRRCLFAGRVSAGGCCRMLQYVPIGLLMAQV